jgi:hypothetical protein
MGISDGAFTVICSESNGIVSGFFKLIAIFQYRSCSGCTIAIAPGVGGGIGRIVLNMKLLANVTDIYLKLW